MRVKNATFVQKHIEKIVLLVAVVFLVIVLAIFVGGMFNPYALELSGRQYDQPSEVFPALGTQADELQADLQRADANLIPADYQAPDMKSNYEDMLEQPVTRVAVLPQRISRPGTPIASIRVPEPPPPFYNVPTPPMPTNIAWEQGFDVLDLQFDPRLNPQFFDLWGGQRIPPDFNYVIVEGEFSMWDWVQALQGESGQTNKVPSGIWKERLGITGVYLIREELDETTGRWGNRTIVRPLPDQIQVMPSEAHSADPLAAQQLIEEVKQLQQFIAQPGLPAVIGDNVLPLPKDDEELLPGQDPQFDEFLGPGLEDPELTDRQRDQLERRRLLEERRNRRNNRNPEEFNEFEGPGGGGDADRQRRQRELEERRRRLAEEEQRRLAEQERQRLEQERLRRERELEREFDDFGNPGGPGNPGIAGLNIQPDEQTRVWAADVTAEYGKTYRYKLAVAVLNPLYGVPRLDKDQMAENATRAAHTPSEQAIAESEWIEPVVIAPKYEFFFVGGSENRSRIEIWTIFNGQRVKQEFEVSAGDPIGGIVTRNLPQLGEREVDLRVGATVVDIERRRDILGQTAYVLIYIDEEGKLHERVQSDDQSDPRRRELEADLREQQRQREEREQFNDFR